jgi:hypothetical protein
MRQRSFSVLLAAATGLAVTGLFAAPAGAAARHRVPPPAAETTTGTVTTTGTAADYGAAITDWAPRGTAVALATTPEPTGNRGDRPRHTTLWGRGAGPAADARTVNRGESTEEVAPSRRPASQFA